MAGPISFIATGTPLADEVEGSHVPSNGHRLEPIDIGQRVHADFGKWSRVQLEEIGPHRFASREGDVQLTRMPGQRTVTILLSYPADSRGRLVRGCS